MFNRSTKDLWCDYLFLTKEMAKFLETKDFDMFNEIMAQRESLQGIIDKTVNREFAFSQDGRQLLLRIKQEEESIKATLRLLLNNAKQELAVNQAYDSYSTFADVGYRMDRQS